MKPTTAAEYDAQAQAAADAATPEIVAPAAPEAPPASTADGLRKYKRTDDETEIAFLALIEQGLEPRRAASQCGLNIRTAYSLLARSQTDIEATRAAFRKLLQVSALERLQDWETASKVGAAKKGNHAPAKDWLLHAGVIDALDSDSASVRIAINIGTDDKPMRIPSPLATTTSSGSDEG